MSPVFLASALLFGALFVLNRSPTGSVRRFELSNACLLFGGGFVHNGRRRRLHNQRVQLDDNDLAFRKDVI
jgi:hypothetical protein